MMEFVITCDGGSLRNGADGCIGYGSFMIAKHDMVNTQHLLNFGPDVTNNEAEYRTLIAALDHISDAFTAVGADLKNIGLTVRTDSQLVIGQLSQNWKVKAKNLISLVVMASTKMSQFASVRFEKISGEEMKSILGH